MKPYSRKRSPALVAAFAALSLLAAGCGGGGEGTSADGKPVEITYWSWMPGTEQTAKAFNKAQDDIRVTFSEIPAGQNGGYDKFAKGLKAGNAPDVMNVEYQALPDLVTQGLLADSSELLGDTVATSPKQVRELVTLGGKEWAAPFDVAPQVMYYRKDLFEKHGIDVPRTWKQYERAAEQIRKADSKARITSFWSDDVATWAGLAQQAGATWYETTGDAWKVNVNDAVTKKVADYWGGLVKDDLVFNHKAFSPQSQKATADGRVYTRIGASWSAGALKSEQPGQSGKWAATALPHWGTASTGMVGGSTFAISKDSEKAEAAAEFITWATTSKEAVKARLAEGTSSALPAHEKLRDTAKESFDTAFFDDQDIYSTASAEVGRIRAGWIWSPVHNASAVQLTTALAATKGGAYAAAFDRGQASAEKLITDRGLKLAD